METNFNLGSLKVVKSFILEYLNKSLLDINNVMSNISNANEIGEIGSVELLDKTQKTLEIIGLRGIANILKICKEATIYVKNGLASKEEAINILTKTSELINNTVIYIGKIIESGFDQPTKFFNEYKELCLLININPNIKDLFFPKLDFRENFNYKIKNDLRFGVVITENNKKYLTEQLEISSKIINENIKKITNGISKNDDHYLDLINSSSRLLYEEFGLLQKIKFNKNIYIYFSLAKVYVCCLSPEVNNLSELYLSENKKSTLKVFSDFKDIISSISKEVEEYDFGYRTNSLLLPEDKIKNLLFELKFLIESNEKIKEMPFYDDVNHFFDFDYYFSQLNETLSFNDFNIFENEEVERISSIFSETKDMFEIIVKNKDNFSEQIIINFIDKNKDLEQSIMSVSSIQRLSLSVTKMMEKIKNDQRIKDIQIKEISSALVMIDYGIDKFIKNLLDDRLEKDYETQVNLQVDKIQALINEEEIKNKEMISLSFSNEENNALMAIFSESNIELIKIEETLDYFLKNNSENIDELKNIKKPLVELKGLFSAIGKHSLDEIIDAILTPWDKIIENADGVFNLEDLKESIELLGGVSLLVKSYADGNIADADEIYQNILNGFYKKHFNQNQDDFSIKEETKEEGSFQEGLNTNNELSEDHMSEENIMEDFGDGDWPLLKELETSRFAIKNKKKKIDIESEEVKPNETEEVNEAEEVKPNETSNFGLLEISNEMSKEDISDIKDIESEETNFDFYWLTESTNDPELAEIFLMEAEEVIQNLNQEFEVLSTNIENKDSITNIRRFFHTLKGSGRMVGLNYMGEAAWMVEQTLNRCLANELLFNSKIYESSQYVKDKFIDWIADLQISNVVNLDLLEIKNKFILINDELKNSFDIEAELEKAKSKLNNFDENNDAEKSSLPEVIEVVDENSNTEESSLPEVIEVVDENSNTEESSLPEVIEVVDENSNTEESSLPEVIEVVDENSNTEESSLPEVIEVVDENSNTEDFILIDNTKISREVYELFNQESDIYILGMSNIVNVDHEEPVILSEQFMRDAHTLSSISSSVNLNKISKISELLEKISLFSCNANVALSQSQINIIRHAVENLKLFKNENISENMAFYESIKNNLDDLYIKISEPNTENKETEESNNKDRNEDMANLNEIKESILFEIRDLMQEKNSEIEKILEVIKDKNNEMDNLKERISSLEEEIASMKESQERKDQMFIKALEVNRGDIKVLVDLIKKMK